jgi:rhodanese-related sulfurtransferase
MARALLMALALLSLAPAAFAKEARPTTQAQVDYPAFASLTDDVAAYRQSRLITLEQFQAMAREGDTLILDARSPAAYARGHIEGAVNVSFTDFTAQYLREQIGDPNRRILIYCNNNFANNAAPVVLKSAPLALNIPTFINLYGYGYRNVYELGDVVDSNDPAVHWVRG